MGGCYFVFVICDSKVTKYLEEALNVRVRVSRDTINQTDGCVIMAGPSMQSE